MNNLKHESMKTEAIEKLIETLEGFQGYYEDLHHEAFNMDYYIIGTYQAKEALKEYDAFEAIEKVQFYEVENFGQVNTDISDPEMLVNMLFYIIGEEVMGEHDLYQYDGLADDETNQEIIEKLKKSL